MIQEATYIHEVGLLRKASGHRSPGMGPHLSDWLCAQEAWSAVGWTVVD